MIDKLLNDSWIIHILEQGTVPVASSHDYSSFDNRKDILRMWRKGVKVAEVRTERPSRTLSANWEQRFQQWILQSLEMQLEESCRTNLLS
jgi:hypothetical protein